MVLLRYGSCGVSVSDINDFLSEADYYSGPTAMAWLRRQAPPAPPSSVEPPELQEPATVSDVLLAYRLILKREADPGGLAAYTERVREGLTLEQLIKVLIDSPERKDRLQAGTAQRAP